MTSFLRIAAHACVALVSSVSSGCYLWHGLDGDERGDGGTPSMDGRVTMRDAAPSDAGPDASRDAGRDAFVWEHDSEPPVGPPPDPAVCRTEPTIYPFDAPVLEYRWPTGPVVHGNAIHVCATPLVIDLDPSGGAIEPVLVFVSYPPLIRDEPPGVLRIVDPRTDTTISNPATSTETGVLEATTNVAAGDLDGDGRSEIVGLGVYAGTYAFRSDGTLLWESAYPTAVDRGLRDARSISGAIAIADLEGDGIVEVVAGRNVLDGATGAHRWTGAEGTGRGINRFLGPISCVADLDGDGSQEVIAGKTAFHADGSIYWNVDVPDGICAVADVTPSSPGPEVVVVGSGYVRMLNGHTGETLWYRQLEGRVRESIGGAPTIADFDADGNVEFGIAHGAAYGVYDPECVAPGSPAMCEAEGLLWTAPTGDDSSSGTGSSVFDFNGDGAAEVIYNDQYYFRVYEGRTGRPMFEWRNSSRTRTENPVIADVDNDGDAEIVFSANAEAFFIRDFFTDPGVEVWGDARGRWVGARRIWNQHAYHITNIDENGHVPVHEVPSWTVLNAYRQNLREGADVLATPDLWGGHGTFECLGGGTARLHIVVQNWGLERVGAGVLVTFYRGHPDAGGVEVGELHTTRVLEPLGGAEEVTLDVAVSRERADYWARLDNPEGLMGGAVAECLEDNNDVLIWRVSCP